MLRLPLAGLALGCTIIVALTVWSQEAPAPSAAEEILRHVKRLASAEFTGRGAHTGTMKGPTGDLPATQRRVELKCVESYRFRDGKLAEGRVYFDAFSLFTQLGVGAPAQGRAAGAPPARP